MDASANRAHVGEPTGDPAWRPIRLRRVVEKEGPPTSHPLVDCPTRGGLVELDDCLSCAAFEGGVVDPSGRASNVRCTREQPLPRPALQARVHEVVRVYACVREDVPADRLASVFDELGVSAAPVLAKDGKLLGVVTKTDLTRERALPAATARDLVTPIHFTVREDQTLEEAIGLMAWKGVHRVPVASRAGGAVVGVLNALDVVRWLAQR